MKSNGTEQSVIIEYMNLLINFLRPIRLDQTQLCSYLTNFLFFWIDAPVCKSDKSEVVGVSKGERVSIKCELDSDPEDVSFRFAIKQTLFIESLMSFCIIAHMAMRKVWELLISNVALFFRWDLASSGKVDLRFIHMHHF